MASEWDIFNEDDPNPEYQEYNSYTPVPEEISPTNNQYFSPPSPRLETQFNMRVQGRTAFFPQSAPSFLPQNQPNPTHQMNEPLIFYSIQFNALLTSIYSSPINVEYQVGDYVVTEADRGFDVGKIIASHITPTVREKMKCGKITGKATQNDITQIPKKLQREEAAIQVCQTHAHQMNLPMNFTGAHFQFDGKKLTFFFTAPEYIDFRDLVKVLFKIFGTRIWMVWYLGNSPIQNPTPNA